MSSRGDASREGSTEFNLENREDAMAKRFLSRLEVRRQAEEDEETADDTSQANRKELGWAVEECAKFFFADLLWEEGDVLGAVCARVEIAPGQSVTLRIPRTATLPDSAGALRSANARFERIQRGLEAIERRLTEWIARQWEKDGFEEETDPDCAGAGAGSLVGADALPPFPRDLAGLRWNPAFIAFNSTSSRNRQELGVRLTFRSLLGDQALNVSIPDDWDPSCSMDPEVLMRDAKLGKFRLVLSETPIGWRRIPPVEWSEGYLWEIPDASLRLVPLPTAGTVSTRSTFGQALRGIPELLARARTLCAWDRDRFVTEIVDFLLDEEVPGPWLKCGIFDPSRDHDHDNIPFTARRLALWQMLCLDSPILSVYADGSARLNFVNRSSWKNDNFAIHAIRVPQGRISSAIVEGVGFERIAVERSARSTHRPARS
jgi:hypothetical protein